MKYSYCEAVIWHVMAPAAFRHLSREEPGWDIPALKQRSKQAYRQMVARTPDIGSLKENALRVCLAAGMLWLSVYEAAQGKMSEERFEKMVIASMNAPLVKASFTSKGKRAFTLKAQKKRAADAARANAAPGGDFNWNTEVILGRDADEYTILYRRCGLCALGRQEGLSHLVPYMCAVDTRSFDWMGGRLYRARTLASGGELCDFYICRKGSKWDRERQGPGHSSPEGEEAAMNETFRMKTDGFHGELFRPQGDEYPGKVLICFGGSDGNFELARKLAAIFQGRGLTTLALAYVMEEGLPDRFFRVPIDPLEAAAERLHAMGYEKVGLWGISKGAELALLAGSLLPGAVNAVVAVDPMSIACQGFAKGRGITVMPGSSWSFHGAEVPYQSFGVEKFPFGQVLRRSLKAREVTMYDLYLPMVERPDPAAVIRVENITGPILLISSKLDTMWPSEPAAKRIVERLGEKGFSYPYRHLSYDYGSHLFVPMELPMAKFFRGDRGKNKAPGRKARMDSLEKTLEFVSRW